MARSAWPWTLGIVDVRLVEETVSARCNACGALERLDAVYEIILNDPAATVLRIATCATSALASLQLEGEEPSLEDFRSTAWLQLTDLGNALIALTTGDPPTPIASAPYALRAAA